MQKFRSKKTAKDNIPVSFALINRDQKLGTALANKVSYEAKSTFGKQFTAAIMH